MDVHDIAEILNGDVGNRFLAVTARIVDQNVAPAMVGNDIVDEVLGVVGIGDIIDVIVNVAADFLAGFRQHVLAAAGDHNGSASGFQAFRGCKAETAAAAGHNCHAAGQIKRFVKIFVHKTFPFCCQSIPFSIIWKAARI